MHSTTSNGANEERNGNSSGGGGSSDPRHPFPSAPSLPPPASGNSESRNSNESVNSSTGSLKRSRPIDRGTSMNNSGGNNYLNGSLLSPTRSGVGSVGSVGSMGMGDGWGWFVDGAGGSPVPSPNNMDNSDKQNQTNHMEERLLAQHQRHAVKTRRLQKDANSPGVLSSSSSQQLLLLQSKLQVVPNNHHTSTTIIKTNSPATKRSRSSNALHRSVRALSSTTAHPQQTTLSSFALRTERTNKGTVANNASKNTQSSIRTRGTSKSEDAHFSKGLPVAAVAASATGLSRSGGRTATVLSRIPVPVVGEHVAPPPLAPTARGTLSSSSTSSSTSSSSSTSMERNNSLLNLWSKSLRVHSHRNVADLLNGEGSCHNGSSGNGGYGGGSGGNGNGINQPLHDRVHSFSFDFEM